MKSVQTDSLESLALVVHLNQRTKKLFVVMYRPLLVPIQSFCLSSPTSSLMVLRTDTVITVGDFDLSVGRNQHNVTNDR